MAYDFRANQVRLNRIISSGSVPILIYPSSSAADFAGNLVPTFSTTAIGTDVFLFVSGSSTAKTVFGGDALTSGSFRSLRGITGSVRYIDASSTPFIVGGPDVTVNYNSLGQWEISGSEASFFTSPSNGVVRTTGSFEATYLSASTGAQVTGSLQVLGGITGSLSGTTSGKAFIVAGPNITASYNSLGQWEITGSAGGGGTGNDFFFSRTANIIEASGSLYLTGSLRTTTLSASLGAIITGSVVQGTGGTASGLYSHAEGYQTQATQQGAHAEGSTTVASNQYAHAEGISTTASGLYSHTEGNSTQATDDGAHAEGYNTQATGKYSHAEGDSTVAAGRASHAEGLGTEAHKDYQTAVGTYNVSSNSTSLFVIGDGASSGTRHDILRAETGNIQVTGSVIVDPAYRITGSIHTVDGTNPYIVGSGITVNYNSLGQYALTASGGGSSFSLSGSTTVYGDGTNRGSGSISGLFDTTTNRVGKYEIDIVAVQQSNSDGAGWKYSTTTFSGNPTSFRFIGINELAEDLSGAGASGWEVNFNDSGTLDVTGSTSASGTFFYARVVNKMVANFNSILF